MLTGLLRRNAKERMPFDVFFNHPFLQRNPPTPQSAAADLPSPFTVTQQQPAANKPSNVVPPVSITQQQREVATNNNNNNVKNGEQI